MEFAYNKHNNYVYGNQEIIPHASFGRHIFDNLKKYSDEIAIEQVDGDKLDFKHVLRYAINTYEYLKTNGIKPGDVVALGMEKRNEYIPCVFGIVFTGATFTPIDLYSGRLPLKHKLTVSKPQYFIVTKSFWEINAETIKTLPNMKFIGFDFHLNPSTTTCMVNYLNEEVNMECFEPVTTEPNDVTFILYSSGTTGLPKGVLLTNLNCLLATLPDELCDQSISTVLCYGEWYHNYDIFKTPKLLLSGKKIVYHQNIVNEIIPDIIMKYKINLAFLIPSNCQYLSKADLTKYDLSSLKILYSRSAPLHNKTIEELKLRIPKLNKILQGYGMTEAGEPTSQSRSATIKMGSVGQPCQRIVIKVVDLKTAKPLGPNSSGEIRLKGDVLMKGYKDIDPSKYLDEEGFFKTGDLGYYDEDHDFFIIDRIKEIISYDGYKVAPLELESLLLLHPGVKEAGVVGKPDPEKLELPTAFVVKQPGYEITEQELINYVAAEVTFYMQLRGGVIFIDKMPRNSRGKILRRELRELLKRDE